VDVNAAAVLIAALFTLRMAGPYMLESLKHLLREALSSVHAQELNIQSVYELWKLYMLKTGLLCMPVVVGVSAVGLVANVMQVGLRVTPKALSPNISRIDPIQGLARLFSFRYLVELGKSLVKTIVVGYVLYASLKKELSIILDLGQMPAPTAAGMVAGLCWRMFCRVALAMVVIGILDLLYQRFVFEKSLRMTKQEVKDEYKRVEGDPLIKARIRQRQREIARGRMFLDVARADVVITNPTHIAVALAYDASSMTAPTVVAKGQRLVAEKIKEIARANNVPIVENPVVARLLYKNVEVGEQIPEELYQAVAEILAYVYRLSQKFRVA
jgi:flagellar biosynthetic protein FlhB